MWESVYSILRGHVVKCDSGCWEWTGYTPRYGQMSVMVDGKTKTVKCHRWVYYAVNGLEYRPFTDTGVAVLHKCDNPPCCNPDHLFAGTQLDNMADAVSKGRHVSPPRGRGESHSHNKLTEFDVATIRIIYNPRIVTCRAISKVYGISEGMVWSVVSGASWTHI